MRTFEVINDDSDTMSSATSTPAAIERLAFTVSFFILRFGPEAQEP